jgi:hypothetical protein
VDNRGAKNRGAKKSKNLVLRVVNGVAKWVDASEVTERFTGLHQERLPGRYLTEKRSGHLAEELE